MNGTTVSRAGAQVSNVLVVGHDRHAAGIAALQVAVDLARRLGAHLHVVHSVTLDDYGIDPDSAGFEAEYERSLRAEHDALETDLHDAGIEWTYHEQRGDPAHALAQLAAELDALYIVVGATHSGGLRHLVGGESVPKRLLRHQRRPVLIVPEPVTRAARGQRP